MSTRLPRHECFGKGRHAKGIDLGAVRMAALIALFPLYWAVVTSLRPRDADLGDLWLPGVTFQPTLVAWDRLLTLPGL